MEQSRQQMGQHNSSVIHSLQTELEAARRETREEQVQKRDLKKQRDQLEQELKEGHAKWTRERDEMQSKFNQQIEILNQ